MKMNIGAGRFGLALVLFLVVPFRANLSPPVFAQSYSLTDIGALCGPSYSVGSKINNLGQVVGVCTFPYSQYVHSFLYSNGSLTDVNEGRISGEKNEHGNMDFHRKVKR
ncbi:MAG TPA: hypothetical protein VEF34_03745 [Syntrophobacteraceae bacterium]|nr:hypothetical protein [Syntrophobacteraceae bacterium]